MTEYRAPKETNKTVGFFPDETKLIIEAVLLYQKAYTTFFCDPLPEKLVEVKKKLGLLWDGRPWASDIEPWFEDIAENWVPVGAPIETPGSTDYDTI